MALAIERRAEERAGSAMSVAAGIAAAFTGKIDAIKNLMKGSGRRAEGSTMASFRNNVESLLGKVSTPRRTKRE